jgi:hypothetical protein
VPGAAQACRKVTVPDRGCAVGAGHWPGPVFADPIPTPSPHSASVPASTPSPSVHRTRTDTPRPTVVVTGAGSTRRTRNGAPVGGSVAGGREPATGARGAAGGSATIDAAAQPVRATAARSTVETRTHHTP